MKKIKFLKAAMPYSLEEAYDIILSNPYERDAAHGFEALMFSSRAFKARFIEKVTTIEVISSPFGETQEFTSVRYVLNDFSIEKHSEFFLIALENPPRSIKSLIRKFSEIFGITKFSVSPININISNLEKFLSQVKEIRIHINKASISNIILDATCSASVEIISSNNAIDDIKRNFPNKSFNIDKARFTLQGAAAKTVFEAKSSGQVSISGPKEEIVYELIQEFIGRQI